jgi:hypothetical protein
LWSKVDQVITSGLIGIVQDGTVVVVRKNGETVVEIKADTIVVVHAPIPNRDLVPVLKKLGISHRIIGDAVAPRLAMQAFKEGHEAAIAV